MKAPACRDEQMPAATQHGMKTRWARPRGISGCSGGAGRRCAARRPLADGLELPDPARSVLLRTHRGVVDGLIDVGLSARQQDEDQPDHLVGHGHDGLLVGLAHEQAAVLAGQGALGHAGGVGALAQDEAHGVVAVAGAAGLALAGALVVARAQRGPAGQALGRAEAGHVVADPDEDERGGDLVDAGDSLQQAVGPGVRRHGAHQVRVDVGELALQRIDAVAQVAQHEQVTLAQVAVEAGGKLVGLALQGAARVRQQHRLRLARDEAAHHGAGRDAVDVADDRAPLYRTCCHPVHGNGPGSATVGGTSQLGGGPVRHRGRAFIRIATSSRLRATLHGAPARGFHARGRVGRLMIG